MAKRSGPGQGSWLLTEEHYERGDSAFVDELSDVHTPDRLGTFAAKWFADPRPGARTFLFDYLDRPLNAFRHEPLVKRLYKLAERAEDDLVVGAFLVAFDRSQRRVRKVQTRYDWTTRESWTEESIVTGPDSTLPREEKAYRYRDPATGDRLAATSPAKHDRLRLFSLRTRRYLRRRAWRYFRELGKRDPDRYVAAIAPTLARYTDEDVSDGLALLDNWGLIHVLFHESPVLESKSSGWTISEGRTLGELEPAPAFPEAWKKNAAPLIGLLKDARCRPVRHWAHQLVRRHHADAFARLPFAELIEFLAHDDAEIAAFAAEALSASPELERIPIETWLSLLEESHPQTLELLCHLMTLNLRSDSLSLGQCVRLASSRPLPVARLGLQWLQGRSTSDESECRQLLGLAEAEAIALRPELIRWLRTALGPSPYFRSDWILELLDSRHADVRREGWTWFLAEPRASSDVALWQKLLESPYDDIRLQVIEWLQSRPAAAPGPLTAWDRGQLDPALVRHLWATVLLNIHRGSRTKPRVVEQIVTRLKRHPNEIDQLLPVLAAAMRSVRGPEWRAGLTALVQLAESNPDLETTIQRQFPELKMSRPMAT